MDETEQQRSTVKELPWQSSDGNFDTNQTANSKLYRRLSSSSESGFHSDNSDELCGSQPSTADSTESTCAYLDGCKWSKSESIGEIKIIARHLAREVVSHMTHLNDLGHTGTPHSATLLRIVDDLSLRHEIVFESVVKKLALKDLPDHSALLQTIVGVGDELFSDGQYNWGRVVTVFAFSGWLARSSCMRLRGSSKDCLNIGTMIADVAGDYIADKLSGWVQEQGGWDTMERFFAEPESLESKLWRGLMFTFVGLGVLAAVAAVR